MGRFMQVSSPFTAGGFSSPAPCLAPLAGARTRRCRGGLGCCGGQDSGVGIGCYWASVLDQLESVEVCSKLDDPTWNPWRWVSLCLCPNRGAGGTPDARHGSTWHSSSLPRHPGVYSIFYFYFFFKVLATRMVPPFPVTCSLQPKDTNRLFQESFYRHTNPGGNSCT